MEPVRSAGNSGALELPAHHAWPRATGDRAIQEATAAIYGFFDAFNGADNAALLEVNHVPQVMLNNGQFLHAVSHESRPVIVDFAGSRANESWDHSVIEDLEVIHAMPGKVIFQL